MCSYYLYHFIDNHASYLAVKYALYKEFYILLSESLSFSKSRWLSYMLSIATLNKLSVDGDK